MKTNVNKLKGGRQGIFYSGIAKVISTRSTNPGPSHARKGTPAPILAAQTQRGGGVNWRDLLGVTENTRGPPFEQSGQPTLMLLTGMNLLLLVVTVILRSDDFVSGSLIL